MVRGEHLYFSFLLDGFPVTHHGIDCGDNYVIEYKSNDRGAKICRTPRSEFGKGRTIFIKEYGKCYPPEQVVERAKSKLGRDGYCLFQNNCEHFAYWCKTGKHQSEQVKNAGAGAMGAVAGVAVEVGAIAGCQFAKEAAIQAANPIAKMLIQVGIKQAPKVAGKAALGIAGGAGLVAGLATDAVVGAILEDDENLPDYKREAREQGRFAGQVGAFVGGVGGAAAAAAIGGGAAVAVAVAAPAVLGIGGALGVYNLLKDKKNARE